MSEAAALLRSPGQPSRSQFSSTRDAGPGSAQGRTHRSARGFAAPVSLTLLWVGLWIRLAWSRVQQLFQLQRQGLRPSHRHQDSLPSAPGTGTCGTSPGRSPLAGSSTRRLLSSARNRAEPCDQLLAGNFREAFGRGRGLRVTTGVKAEAPWRLKGLSPYSRECACACVRGLCSAVRERAKYVPDPRVQHKLRSKWPLSLYLKYTARLVQDTLTNKVYSSREPWWRIWEGGGGKA